MTPRNAAKKAGKKFFIGNVCKEHPELKGKRRVKSGGCHECIIACNKVYRTTEKYRAAYERRYAASKKEAPAR
jgi:aldehyde:ferredoxin oxidoreductase